MKKFLLVLMVLTFNVYAMECRQKAQEVALKEGYETLEDIGTVDLVDTEIVSIIHMYKEEYNVTVFPVEYDGPVRSQLTYNVKMDVLIPGCKVTELKLID